LSKANRAVNKCMFINLVQLLLREQCECIKGQETVAASFIIEAGAGVWFMVIANIGAIGRRLGFAEIKWQWGV